MSTDEYSALMNDIRANGVRVAITLYKGKILDGRHRAQACNTLRIRPPCVEFIGNDDEAKAFVLSINAHRRHLSMKQRRDLIAAELKRDPSQSDRSIAKKAKVSHPTVAKARREANGKCFHKPGRTEATGRKARGRKPAITNNAKHQDAAVTKPSDLAAARILKELAGIKPNDLSEPRKFASELFNHMKRFAATIQFDMGKTA